MNRLPNDAGNRPFRPCLSGCVAQDLRMARAIGECYQCELYAIAAYLWRSLMCERHDRDLSELFERYAREEIEHFRLVGELISSLGGVPALYTQVRIDPARYGNVNDGGCVSRFLSEAIADEKQMIDRFQTLMGKTNDRVVRSILTHLVADEHRHMEQLQRNFG